MYLPQHEQKNGSNLSGSSGDLNRTYTLANSDAILANMQIIIAQAPLQPVVDFTLDTSTDTITFLNPVWDDQAISIDYWTEDTTSVSADTYCNTLHIIRFCGIGNLIEMENLGTGDGSTASYDLDNGNVIADSYTIRYADSGSNDFSKLSEGTDYAINKDAGTIVLTSAGISTVNSKVIYISYTHCEQLSDTVLATYLKPAAKKVEKRTGNYYGTVKSSTQYFDGYESGYPTTESPMGTNYDEMPEFQLDNESVQTITSVKFLGNTGATNTEVDSDYIRLAENGRVILTNSQSIPIGKRNIEIIYTHGYTAVPEQIIELAALYAGKMALLNITGGSYDAITSWQVGRAGFTQGEQYVNIREVLDQVNKSIKEILEDMGYNYGCA